MSAPWRPVPGGPLDPEGQQWLELSAAYAAVHAEGAPEGTGHRTLAGRRFVKLMNAWLEDAGDEMPGIQLDEPS